MECPRQSLKTIQAVYPMIKKVEWNRKKSCFEIFEEISDQACLRHRRILDYRNDDNTPLPFIADQAIKLLRMADTRYWPLEERMKLFDKEDEKEEKQIQEEVKDYVGSVIKEEYNYIAGIPTFFMGDSMKVHRARYRPGQETILKAKGLA